MTLNLKNYKGYKKLPYCTPHYPSTGFTSVAETPESRRLKQNTTNQSSAVYQKEHNQDRGKITSIADDPESVRARKTQKQASLTAYKGTAPPGSREATGKGVEDATD